MGTIACAKMALLGPTVKVSIFNINRLRNTCYDVLGVKKLYVAEYPDHKKDICDILDPQDWEGSVDAFSDMWWNAPQYKPVDIIDGSQYTWESIFKEPVIGYDFPFKSISDKIGGIRMREHTVWMAGSGVGKTTFCRKIGHHMGVEHGWKVGSIFLEEQDEKTVQGYIGCHLNIALNHLRTDPDQVSMEDRDSALQMISDHHMFLKHSGSIDPEVLMSKLRYLYNMGCKLIIFDHLTMAVNGEDDQRIALDNLMEDIYTFCENHDIHVMSVIHLSRDSKSLFSRGAEISENNIRGSAGVLQQCWNAIAVEADIQHEKYNNYRFARVIKCREIGDLGLCDGGYIYDDQTGVMTYDETLEKDMIFEDDSGSGSSGPTIGGRKSGKSEGKYDNKAS